MQAKQLKQAKQIKQAKQSTQAKKNREDDGDDDPKSCFKFIENRIYISWDSQISQTVFLIFQLQNHKGFEIWWCWRVAKLF